MSIPPAPIWHADAPARRQPARGGHKLTSDADPAASAQSE